MASSSSSSPSAPAFSSQSWSHDVFLSFRGDDTRKTFVDHLYSALVAQGIDTYKDDETLSRGELIGASLMKAIEESQIAVIVFSVNYADSSWCLDELAHIMKCKDTMGQIVMPIFYDVDPSTVRHQKEKYREAFDKHKLQNKNKVKTWKKTLFDASSISGWEITNIDNGRESKAIKKIVDEVSTRLKPVIKSANDKLVGIARRVRLLKSALQIGSVGVCMIGIWGLGGDGKTTLAESIFDEISKRFDGCCFINNIREESMRPAGLEKLEEKILSKLGANSVGSGRRLNKLLRNGRVLIVLDDVDKREQLKALAGSRDWFGEGSRIIITTRDEQLLKAREVVVHDINLLDDDEAIELFRKHAFQGHIPTEEYEQLSKEVVLYARGLPLALEVLGSSLCLKNNDQWRSALARLKEIPDDEILQKLKVSFDGLTKVQKDLFLDIACFYRREYKHKAMEHLETCGFHPVIGVEELRQKALITINSIGQFDMHDLVEEMGHYIVRGEHPKNPEKHSRVWKEEDFERICAMDAIMELDKIEVIEHYYENSASTQIVASMRNLRCLIMRRGIQDRLWNGCKVLPNLKIMELHGLPNLIITPDLDGIPYLERFKLNYCLNLEEIHPSLGRLDRLVYLSIDDCKGIKKFPSITQLRKLEILSLRQSPNEVFELSEIQQKMDNLVGEEDISSAAVWELSNLNHIIRLCFFRKDLKKLDLYNCNLGDEDMSSAVWELPNLQELDLSMNNFSRLNFSTLMRTPRLKRLDVSWCWNLRELSELPSSIAVIDAHGCSLLKTIGDISNCIWLWNLSLCQLSLEWVDDLSPFVGHVLLDSILKGNAIEDHFISVALDDEIPEEYVLVGSLFRGNTFRMRLPHDWCNDFSGFLIHVVTHLLYPDIKITIQEEKPDENLPFEFWDKHYPDWKSHKMLTYVGYVSINSLRPTACFSSTYNVISITIKQSGTENRNRIGVSLVPRKTKDDHVKTSKVATDSSQFGKEKDEFGPTFEIKHAGPFLAILRPLAKYKNWALQNKK